MKSQCDADVARARREAQLAKESAQQALEFDRSRAEQTIANALSKERTEKLQLQRDLKETADRLNREWASKLRHLEIKVKNAEESKKIAVERATERLKRAHAADLAASVREATMAASKAAMEQKSKSSTCRESPILLSTSRLSCRLFEITSAGSSCSRAPTTRR